LQPDPIVAKPQNCQGLCPHCRSISTIGKYDIFDL